MNKNSPLSKIRRGKKQDKHKIAQLKCSGKLIEGRFVIVFTVVPTTSLFANARLPIKVYQKCPYISSFSFASNHSTCSKTA